MKLSLSRRIAREPLDAGDTQRCAKTRQPEGDWPDGKKLERVSVEHSEK